MPAPQQKNTTQLEAERARAEQHKLAQEQGASKEGATPSAEASVVSQAPTVATSAANDLETPQGPNAIGRAIEQMIVARAVDQRQEQALYASGTWAGIAAAIIKTQSPTASPESRRRMEQLQQELVLLEESEKKKKKHGSTFNEPFLRAMAAVIGEQAVESINQKIEQAQKGGGQASPQQAAQLAKDIAAALKSNDSLLQLYVSTQAVENGVASAGGTPSAAPSGVQVSPTASQRVNSVSPTRGEQLDIRHPLNHPVPEIRDAIIQMAQPGVNPSRGMITLPEIEPIARQLMPAAKNLGFQGTRDQFTEALYMLAQRVEDGQGVHAEQIHALTERHLTEKHGPPSPHLVSIVTDLLARVQYAKAASLNEGEVAHAILADGSKPATVYGQVLADQAAGILEATGGFTPAAAPAAAAAVIESTAAVTVPASAPGAGKAAAGAAATATVSLVGLGKGNSSGEPSVGVATEPKGPKKIAAGAHTPENLQHDPTIKLPEQSEAKKHAVKNVAELTKHIKELAQKAALAHAKGDRDTARTLEVEAKDTLADNRQLVAKRSPQEQVVINSLFSSAKAAEDGRLEQAKKNIDAEITLLAKRISDEAGAQVANKNISRDAVLKRFDEERAALIKKLDPSGEMAFKDAEVTEARQGFEKQLDITIQKAEEANRAAAEAARIAQEKEQKRAAAAADFSRRAEKDLLNAVQFNPEVAPEILKTAQGAALIKKHLEGLTDATQRVAFFSSLKIGLGKDVVSEIAASYDASMKRSLLTDIRDMSGNLEADRAAAVKAIQEAGIFQPAQVATLVQAVATEKAIVMSRLEAETKRKAQDRREAASKTIEQNVQAVLKIAKEHPALGMKSLSLEGVPDAEQPERLLQALGDVLPELKGKSLVQAAEALDADAKLEVGRRSFLGLSKEQQEYIKEADDPLIHLRDAFTKIKDSRAEIKGLEKVEKEGVDGEISRMKEAIAEDYGTLPGFEAAYAQGLSTVPQQLAGLAEQVRSGDKQAREKASETLLQIDFAVLNARLSDAVRPEKKKPGSESELNDEQRKSAAVREEETKAGRQRELIVEFRGSLGGKQSEMANALRRDMDQKIEALNAIEGLSVQMKQAAASEAYFREIRSVDARRQIEELRKGPILSPSAKKGSHLGGPGEPKGNKSKTVAKEDPVASKRALERLKETGTIKGTVPNPAIVKQTSSLSSEITAHERAVKSLKASVNEEFSSTKQELRKALFSGTPIAAQDRERREAAFQQQLSGDGFERAFEPHTGPKEDPHKSARYGRDDVKKGFDQAYGSIATAHSAAQRVDLAAVAKDLPVAKPDPKFSAEVSKAGAVLHKKPGEGAEPHLLALREAAKGDAVLAQAFSQIPQSMTGPEQIAALKNKLSFSPLNTEQEYRDNAARLMRIEIFVHANGQPGILNEIGVRDTKAGSQDVWDTISKRDPQELASLAARVRGARVEQDFIAALGLNGTNDREKLEAFKAANGGTSIADQMLARRAGLGGPALAERIVVSPLALPEDHKKLFGSVAVPQDKEARRLEYARLSRADYELASGIMKSASAMLAASGNGTPSLAQQRAETALAYEFSGQQGDRAGQERYGQALKKIDGEIEAKFAGLKQPLSPEAQHRLGIESELQDLVNYHNDAETAKILDREGQIARGVKEVSKLLADKELVPTDPKRPLPSMRDAAVDTIRQLNLTETQSTIFKGLYSQNLQRHAPHATHLTGSLEKDLSSGKVFAAKDDIAKLLRGGKESLTSFDIQNALRGIEMGDAHQTVRSVALLKASGLIEDSLPLAKELREKLEKAADKLGELSDKVLESETFKSLSKGLGSVTDYTLDSAAYFASVSSEKVMELAQDVKHRWSGVAAHSKAMMDWAAKETGADKLVDWTLNTTLVMGVTQLTKEGYDDAKKGAQALVDYVHKNGAEAGQWLYDKMASQITPEMSKIFNEALDELSLEKLDKSFHYSKGRGPRPFAALIERRSPQGFGESDANAMDALMNQMEQDTAKRSAGREMSAGYLALRAKVREQNEEAVSFKYSVLNKLTRTRTQYQQMCSTACGDRNRVAEAGRWEKEAANKVLDETTKLQKAQLKLLNIQNPFFAEVEGGERLIWRRGAEILGCYLRDSKHLLSLDTSDKELTDIKKKSLTVDWREVDEKAFETWHKEYKDAIESYQTIVWRVQVAKTVATTGVMVGTSFIPGVGALGAFAISSVINIGEKGYQYASGQMDGGEAVRQILIDGAIDLALAKWLSRGKALARTSPDAQYSAFKKGVNTETYVKYTDWWGRGAKLSKESPKRVNVHISPVAEKPLISQLKGTNIDAGSYEKLSKAFSKANAKDGTNVYAATIELVDSGRKLWGTAGGTVAALAELLAKRKSEKPEQPRLKEQEVVPPAPVGRGGDGKGPNLNEEPIELAPRERPAEEVTLPQPPPDGGPNPLPGPGPRPEPVPEPDPKPQVSPVVPAGETGAITLAIAPENNLGSSERGTPTPPVTPPAAAASGNSGPAPTTPEAPSAPTPTPPPVPPRVEPPAPPPPPPPPPPPQEPKAYTVFGDFGGIFDNVTFGNSLNTGGIFVSASSRSNVSPIIPPPPPPVTPTNAADTKPPRPPAQPGGLGGPQIEVAKDLQRVNSLVAEELRLAQARAQEQAVELAVASAQSDAAASKVSHANAQASAQAGQLQHAEEMAASLSEAQRIEMQNLAAVAAANAEVVRLKEESATAAAAQERSIAAALQATQLSTTDITESSAYASALEQAVASAQRSSAARGESSRGAAGEEQAEGTIQMNLVGRKPQAHPALRETTAEAAAAASNTAQQAQSTATVAQQDPAATDAQRREAQMIESLSSQLTTLDKLEAAARAVEALERHEAREAEQARKERLAKKARAQSRLRAIIMHQLLTMRFERLRKERMLQLLIRLGISEREYRDLVMKVGEREVQAQAERQRRAEPIARPTPAAASRAAAPSPSPLKPPVALKETATKPASQPQQQPKSISRAELYVRMRD